MASSVISWTSWTTGARVPAKRITASSILRSSAEALRIISWSTMGCEVSGSITTLPWSTLCAGWAITPSTIRFWRIRERICPCLRVSGDCGGWACSPYLIRLWAVSTEHPWRSATSRTVRPWVYSSYASSCSAELASCHATEPCGESSRPSSCCCPSLTPTSPCASCAACRTSRRASPELPPGAPCAPRSAWSPKPPSHAAASTAPVVTVMLPRTAPPYAGARRGRCQFPLTPARRVGAGLCTRLRHALRAGHPGGESVALHRGAGRRSLSPTCHRASAPQLS